MMLFRRDGRVLKVLLVGTRRAGNMKFPLRVQRDVVVDMRLSFEVPFHGRFVRGLKEKRSGESGYTEVGVSTAFVNFGN